MPRTKHRHLRRYWLYIAFVLASFGARSQPHEVQFRIPSEPIATALVVFAEQAELSIGHAGIDFHGAVSNAVDGRLSSADALNRLLAGTGYGYVFLDLSTVRIRTETTPLLPAVGVPLIEEIVITATKRDEVAQTLPYSIAVSTGRELDAAGARTANDLTAQIAGFGATNLGSGQDKLFIRGLSDGVFSGRSEPTVGLYLDEARVTDNAPDPGLRLVDIDRIEVVRGPQGTLYGSGSLAGLVRIISNQPVLDRGQGSGVASLSATAGGGISRDIEGTFNMPVINGELALRAVGYLDRAAGYIDDVRLGLRDVNKTDTEGGRLTLRWQPDARWSITAGLTYQTISAADSHYAQSGLAPLQRANFLQEPHRDRFFLANLTAEGAFDWARIVSTTAFVSRRINDRFDASLVWPTLTGFPVAPSAFDGKRDIKSITHETRLTSSPDGSWKWIAGVLLSHRDEDAISSIIGPDANVAPFVARSDVRDDHANEAALFGELTYQLDENFSLIAGLRLSYSDLDVSARSTNSAVVGVAHAQGANHKTDATRKLVLNYHPENNLTFYAEASEGFRLGGVNINSPAGSVNEGGDTGERLTAGTFDSDRLWDYEIGAKTSFLDGRIIANAAAYFITWDDVQTDQLLPDGSSYIANAGGVNAPGFEIDVLAQMTDRLRLQGNFFRNDPELVNPNPLLVTSRGRLPGTPEMSFGFSARYDVALSAEIDAFAGLGFAYVGKSHIGFDHTSPTMGDYSITNVRLGIACGRWQGVLTMDNLTNEQANTFAYGNPFSHATIGQITPPRPRTFGMSLSWSN